MKLIAALLFGFTSAFGAPIIYTISFAPGSLLGNSPAPLPSGADANPVGSFSYDSATGQFAGFRVNFANRQFDLTSAANGFAASQTGPQTPCTTTTGGPGSFGLLSGLPGTCSSVTWFSAYGGGGYNFSFFGNFLQQSGTGFSALLSDPRFGNTGIFGGSFTISAGGSLLAPGDPTSPPPPPPPPPPAEIPEPSTWMAASAALTCLIWVSRRKH